MSKIFVTVSIFVVLGGMLSAAGAVSSDTTYCKTAMSKDGMLDKFLRYVRVSSQSQYGSDPSAWAMTPGQVEMSRILEEDARAIGAVVYRSDDSYVYVDVRANVSDDVPVLGISCHLDFTPEAPGDSIVPIVIRNYGGGDILQGNDSKIYFDSPEGAALKDLIGATIVHTDGTTLLGGDDKNGVTIAMCLIETLMGNPEFKHGRVQFVFCPNEDVGMAAERIDKERFNPDILYDLDGGGGADIITENFTARGLDVQFIGHYAHPGDAKAQKLGDALAAASAFIANIPVKYRPENTEGKEGYIHPWNMTSDGNDYTVSTRIRYFDKEEGEEFDRILRADLDSVGKNFPNVEVKVIQDKLQYENVAYNMHPESRAIMERAASETGVDVNFKSERGGTTASMFTAKGLRGGMCIFTGQHAIHSTKEYSVLEEMHDAYRLMLHAIASTSRN